MPIVTNNMFHKQPINPLMGIPKEEKEYKKDSTRGEKKKQ
jgi:hypothetical protein